MNRLLTFSITLFLLGCQSSEQELGNGYYWLPKYESKDIGYPNEESIIYKSDKRLHFNDIKIRGDVVSANSDQEHVVAKRKPNDSKEFEYYIIIKKLDSIVGPVDLRSFEENKKKLSVRVSL